MENTSTNTKPISKLKIGGEVKHVDQQFLQDNLDRFSQKYGNETVYVTNPDGQKGYIPISQLRTALDEGYTLFDDAANIQVATPQNQESPKPQEQSKPQEPHIPTPGEEFYARNIAPNVNNQLVDIFTDATKPVNNSIQQAAQAVSNLPEVPRVPGQTDLEYAEKVTAISNKVLKAQQEAETQRMLAEALPTRQEELDGRLAEIDGELSSLGERRYGKLDANPAYGNPMLMGIDINAYQKSRLSDEDRDRIKQLQSERDALQLQKSFLNTIQKYESYDRKGDKSGISNFFRAIKVGGDLQSLASFGLTKMQDDLNFRRILEKVNNNETLSLEEKKAMQMYLNMQEVASLDRGASFSAGLGMQQTFEFMRDIALTAMTGGVGAGSMLAKQGVMAITKQFLKNSAKKIGEVAIKTPLTPSFYKGLTAAQVDNYEMGIDYDGEFTATPKRGNAAVAYRTFAETGVEFFTESLSGLLGSIGIAKRLANTVKGNGILSKALKTYDTVLDKTKQNPVGEKILQGLSTLGIGNIPEEMFEEIAAVPLRSLVLGENQMEQLLDPRFYQEVLISTAAIGGMTGATNILIGGSSAAIEKKKINDRIKKSRTVLSDFVKNADSNIKSAYDKLANDLDNDNFYDEDGEFAPEVLVEDLKGLRDATDNNQDIMTQAEDFVKYTMFKKGQTEALRAMAEEELGPIEYGNSGSVMLFHDNTDGRTYHILGETEDVMILGTNDKTIAPDGKLVVPKNTVHGQISKPISLHNYVTDYFINKPEPTTVETLDDISEVQHFGGVATINDGVQVTINRGDKAMYGDVTVEVLDIYDSGDGTIEASVQDENGETHNISFNELSPIPKSDDLTTKDRYILPDGRRAVVQSAQGGNVILGVLDDNNQIVEEIPSTMDEVIGLSKVPAEEANVVEAVAAESGAIRTESGAIGTESGAIGIESGAIGTETGAIGTDELPLDKDGNVDYDTLLAQSPARFVEQMRADFGAEVADVQLGKMVGNIDNKITELSEKVDKETSPNKVASMLREINTLQGQRDAISSALAPVEPTATIEATPAESAETTQEIAPDANNIANVATSAPVEEISAEDAETSAPVEEIKPVGVGLFGEIYDQFKGKAKEAIAFLKSKKDGIAIAALRHNDVGDIDLAWGIEDTEVDNLQEIVDNMRVVSRSGNRINLESDTHQAALSLNSENGNWLLTAFKKKNSVPNNRMDTDETSTEIKENDTATLQNTVSEDKDTTTNNVEEKTETKPNDNQTETETKPKKTILETAQDTVQSSEITAAAKEANTEPTEAQKEAGNYKKGHTIIQGLNISIEQPKGSTRSGKDPDGKKWSVKMNNHYGYIRGTKGKDKDHIDVFLGDSPTNRKVFVVDQINSQGSFDEHKVMIGFDSIEEAKAAYLSNYEEGWQGLGNITETSMAEFRQWISDGSPKTRPFAEHAQSIPESRKKRVAEWKKKLGINITMYDSIDAIEDKSVQEQLRAGIGVSGWISRNTDGTLKEIGVYLPNIKSNTDIDKTAIHEVVAHYGLRGLLGEAKYDELCDIVWGEMNLNSQNVYSKYPGVNGDKRKAADEYIAHLAESLDPEILSRSDKSVWERIVERVKSFFVPHKKADIDLSEAISNADLSTLLRASYARLAAESKKKPSKFKLEDVVLKDKNSPKKALTGVYHDSGYKVASDTNILVAMKENYPKSAEGKVYVKGEPITESNYPKWKLLFEYKFEKSNIPIDFDELIEKLSTIKKNEGKSPHYVTLRSQDGKLHYFNPDNLMKFAKAAKEIGGELMMRFPNPDVENGPVILAVVSPKGKAIIISVLSKDYISKDYSGSGIYDISFIDQNSPIAQFIEEQETKENQTETKPKPKKTKEKPTTSKEVSFTPSKGKVQDQKIEDFGEKIGGARKDVARQRVRDAVNLTNVDLQKLADPDKILSRANIIKSLREGTMTKEDAITLMAMNNTVRCADSTEKYIMMPKYRDMALAWANGQSPIFHITDKDIEDRFDQIGEHIKARMNDAQVEKHKQNIKKYYDILYGYYSDYIKTYRDLDYPNVERKLSGAVIWENPSTGSYWVFKKADARRGRSFRTREAAIAYMEREYAVVVAKAKESKTTTADNSQKIGHLRVVKDSTGWFRIKSSEIPGEIYFSKSFSTRKGAEEYLQENRDTLIAKEQRAIDALMGSNIGMAERQGPDYRNGKDVTSDEYLQAFGFRGVEFGNWVPQAERQMYLNKSYDAIMDICSILGISPKAFSLGGKLAIAFGARGHSKAMAHYESSKQVINLTRMKGVGSFAHEWFHAIDNYLARENSGNTTEFVTEKHPTKRQELYDAFNEFVSKMNTLDYTRRSRRAGDYWGSVIERAARMFESYIYTELGAKDISSPLLVDSHSVLSDEYLLDSDISSYPIPTAEETRQIKPYLDKIFATIQEEVDADDNHILFRVAENVGSFEDVLRNARDKGYENLSAYPDVTNQMLEDALTSGRIMVYSKDPIAGGTIVSPSVQYASELSGSDAQIYSKDISIDQVAWETPDQGTYTTNDDIRFRLIREQDAVSINTSEEINSYFNDELQKQIEGTLPKGHVYQIGMPSDILRSAGIPNLPIEMSSQRLVHKSNQKNHPFDLSEVIDLPKAIQSPLGVFRSATHIGSNVILTELKQGNKNFVVAIQTNKQKGRIQINDIRSIHPRTTSNIINWINEGLMDYADVSNLSSWIENKIKSRDYLNSSTPAEVRKSLVSAAKVVKDFKNPNTDDIRFRFIGEQGAANLDRAEEASIRMDNLAVAREMETAGKDAKTIKMATGWERGADKKWRYEVDDNIDFDSPIDRLGVLNEELRSTDNEKDRIIRLLLRFPTRGRTDKEKEAIKQLNKKHQTLIHKADALRNSIREIEDEIRETTLQSLIGEENNLFKEYPQLAETTVSFIRNSNYGNYKGFYSPAEDYIWISPDNGQPASTLIHEIQHAIQHIEGFAKGGSTDTGNILRDRAKAWSWKKQLEETEKEHPELAGTIELQNILEEEYKDMSNMLPTEDIRNKGFNLYARGYDNEGYESAFEQWTKLGLIGNPNDYRTYKNLAGEVEARNVQKRMWMPLSIRRESLAQETEDVSREDQIFIMDEFSAAENDIRFRIESLVERTYRKDGSFSFSGKNKIESTDDVAFIFKQLEDSAIENAFMVFVKDGKPTILHVGMGNVTSSIIDSSVVLPAYQDFGADKVYVVHNHPSGNLIASKADIDMLLATKAQLPDVPVEGIIINTLSGNYAIINEDKVKPILEIQDTVELEVLSFSKNVFSPDYKTTIGDRTIYGPESIAAYLSAHRLGSGSKVGALLLNHRNVINGNLVTNSNEVSTENAKDLAFDIAEAANRCSATAVVLFGDFDYSDKAIRKLERQIPIVSGKTVSMLDVVRLNGKHTQSLHDMTLPSRSTLSDGVRFRVEEQTDQNNLRDNLRAAIAGYIIGTNTTGNLVTTDDMVNTIYDEVANADDSSLKSSLIKCIEGYEKNVEAGKLKDSIITPEEILIEEVDDIVNLYSDKVMFRISNVNQRVFISNAEQAVRNINMGKAPAEQWLKTIMKSGGLKAGEDKWIGLSDWLKMEPKDILTKDEVLQFINDNIIDIQEQHYTSDVDFSSAERKQIEFFNKEFTQLRQEAQNTGQWFSDAAEIAYTQMGQKYGDDFTVAFNINQGELYVSNFEAASSLTGIQAPIEREIEEHRLDYTTEGLDNNREIALIVPTIESWNRTDEIHFGDAGDGRAIAWARFGETTIQDPLSPKALAAEEARRKFIKEKKEKYGNDYLSHLTPEEIEEFKPLLRFSSTYKKALEKKVLVIDEIQSKRHQEGREKGYKSTFGLTKEKERLSVELDKKYEQRGKLVRERENEKENEMVQIYRIDDALMEVRNNRDYDRLMAERDAITTKQQNRTDEILALEREIKELEKELGELAMDFGFSLAVPDAPFEKNWHELTMKRMLRLAAENGYDKIAWTTGGQQAQRYNIGQKVDKIISFDYNDNNGSIEKQVLFHSKDGQRMRMVLNEEGVVISGAGFIIEGTPFTEVVGKDISQKVMNNEGENAEVFLGGNNYKAKELDINGLHIGGEGMKGFYDKMLPSFMNKYCKKWGVKVEDLFLPKLGNNGLTMHSVDITHEMKASVLQGQLMFRVADNSVSDEVQSIINAAKANGTYMQAPNGKPSNLNPVQWAIVRTENFKRWFGDWEKAARIEKLRDSNAIKMKGDEYKGKYELNRDSAQNYILASLRDEYTILDTNERIKIIRKGAKKVTSHSIGNDAHIKSIAIIPDIIKSAIFITEMPADKNDAQYDSYKYYVCGLDYNGESYTVKMTVGIKDGEYYYDHTLTDIEKGKLLDMIESNQAVNRQGFTPTVDKSEPSYTLSDIKDRRLISILQTDASKVVDENFEPRIVYHGTPNKFTTFDSNYIGTTSGDKGLFGAGFYFNPNKKYVKMFAQAKGTEGYTIDAFVNIKNPYIVEEHDINDLNKYMGGLTEEDIRMFKDIHPISQIKVLSAGKEEAFSKNLQKAGYDGVMTRDYDPRQIVAFEPTQIKSATDNTGAFNPQDADIQYRIPTTTAEDISKNGFQSYLSEKGYDQMKKDILKGAPILRMSQYTPESYISSTVDRLISDMPDGKLEAMQMAAAVRDAFDREGIFLDMSDNEIIYSLWKEVNPDTAVTVKETLEYSFRSSDVRFRIDQNVGPVTNDIKLSKGEIFTENWVDKMISVKMFQELIKRRGGVVSDELNPYITENLSLGRQQRENELFKDKIYRPMVEQVTEVEKLFVALGLASKEEAYKAVNDYLYARHAPERNKHVVIEEISNYLYKFITKDEAKFINYDNIQSAIRALATRIYNETFEGRPKTSDTAARGMLITKGKTKEENEQLKEFRNKFFGIVASAQTMASKISTSKQGNNRSGMTDKEAKEIVQKLYRDDTKDALDRLSELVRASTHFTLDTWYKYNMISAKERDNYKGMYKYYIPLRNWEDTEDVDYENLTYQAFNHASEIISTNKRARGRTSRADNPLAYIASLAQSAIVLGNKNQVRLNMFRLVQKNSALLEDVATIPTVYYIKENSGEITAQIEKPEQELFDKGLVETKTNRDYRWHKTTAEYQAHLIPVIINGTRHVIEMRGNFGLKVASAVNNTNAVHLSYLDKVRPVTQWLSATRTSYNPEFIPTNFIRDFMFGNIAYAVEGGSMRKLNRNLGRAFRAINRSELGMESADIYDLRYREFMREGGQTGFMNMRNIEHMKKDLEKMHREMLETKNVSDVIFRNFFMKGGANIMKYLNAMSENAMRFAVFLTEREKGASAKQAAFAAKEITVNFNRKGRYTDNMGAMYSFFNASIQGTARLYNLVKGHKKQAMIAIASLTAVKLVSALVASAVGGDDYDELSDYVKFSNIIIPIGVSEDGRTRFLKIPMAQGLRAITNIADVTVDVLRGTKTVAEAAKVFALNNLGEHIPLSFEAINLTGRDSAASFAIPFLPTALVPGFEAWRNVDFKGDPIFREDFTLQSEEYSPRYTRAYNSTNPIYTELSRWLNNLAGGNDELTSAVKIDENGMVSRRAYEYFFDINPAKVEHIINGFMGGVTTFPSNIIKTVSAAVSDEKDIEWYNVPILNRFVAQSSYKEGYDLFYRTGDLVRDIKASEKAVKAIGDMDAYSAIKSNMFNAEITRTYELYQDGVKQLREYLENPNLSNEMLKEYERRLDELMREASERFEQIYNKYDTNIERYEED